MPDTKPNALNVPAFLGYLTSLTTCTNQSFVIKQESAIPTEIACLHIQCHEFQHSL